MDKECVKRIVARGSFIENNGKILRFLNLLETKERTLQSLCYIMQDVAAADFKTSLLYLLESGYIRVDHPDGAACIESGPLDTAVVVDLTAPGIELLMGIQTNPSVEI